MKGGRDFLGGIYLPGNPFQGEDFYCRTSCKSLPGGKDFLGGISLLLHRNKVLVWRVFIVGTGVTVNAFLPGVVNTDGLRNMPFKQHAFIRFAFALPIWFLMKTAKDGAQTATYAACAQEEDTVSGKVFA